MTNFSYAQSLIQKHLKVRAQVQIAANQKMLGKFNFLHIFHIWVSFLKIYGFNDFFGMQAAKLFVQNVSSFLGFKKNYVGSN